MHDPLTLAWSIPSPIPRRAEWRESRTDQPRWSIRRKRYTDKPLEPIHPWWRPAGLEVRLAGRCYKTTEMVAVWHVEPNGRDALSACGPASTGRWRWHVRHWRIRVRPWQRFRGRFDRCAECGRRMNTASRHTYMGSDRVWHDGCMLLRDLRSRSDDADQFIAHLFHRYRLHTDQTVEEAIADIAAAATRDPGHGLWRERYRLKKKFDA